MQPFPHPNDASDKIWLQSACWSRRYSCLKVWTHARTHGRTDTRTHGRTDARTPARVPSYKLTLWAFGSVELTKNKRREFSVKAVKPIITCIGAAVYRNSQRWTYLERRKKLNAKFDIGIQTMFEHILINCLSHSRDIWKSHQGFEHNYHDLPSLWLQISVGTSAVITSYPK